VKISINGFFQSLLIEDVLLKMRPTIIEIDISAHVLREVHTHRVVMNGVEMISHHLVCFVVIRRRSINSLIV